MTGGKITFANGGEYEVSERVIQTMDPEDNTTPMVVTELTNAHTSQTVKVQATKVWADEKNADGLRKDIHFKLVGTYTAADNKTYTVENIANATQTVKAADTDLTKTWDNLPKYYDGKEIVYTVVEVETPEGYTGAYYKDGELSEEVSEGQLTYNKETKVWEVWVKNEHIVNKIDISATKAWNDGNAPAVHETIKLKLSSAPEVEIKEPEKTIDSKAAGSGLTVSWIGLPEYKDGEKVVYTVTETQGDARYTANVGEITYAYDAAKQLYTGTVTVTNTPIRNMLKLHKAFSFQGTALNPSELTDAQKKNLSFTVTTQLGGKTYYAVYDKETSAEAGNIHGKYAKLTTQASSFTYADFSDGMLVLENLPVGTYTVTENGKDMLEGYTWSQAAYKVGRNGTEKTEKEPETVTVNGISVSEGDFTQVFFTNEYTEKVGEIKVVKEVSVHEKDIAIDANKLYRVAVYRLMKDGKDDPAGSKMYYTTNGKVVTESDAAISNRNLWVELKAGDSNAQLWKNLPVGTYYVEEYANSAKVEGYTVTTTVAPEKVEVTTASKGDSAVSLKVKNDYEQDRGELNIEKRIFVDDAEVAAPQTGETASEDYTKMKDTAFYVKVAYKDANGVTWYVTDSNGSLSKDPKVLKVTLAAPLNIKHAPAGLYTITEVKEDGSKLEDGKDGEIKLLAGISTTKATAVVEKGKEGSAEIINRYTSDKFAVVVRKVWQDENNRDDLRPKSIQVSLYRSSGVFQELLDWFTGHGTKIGDYTLNEENNWTQVVTGLPRYGFLGNYAYRWFETNKINGYTTTISRPSVSTDHMTEITTITNTHEAAKVEIEANKIWRNGTADVTATIKNASVTFTLQQKVEGGDWQHVLADQGTHGAGNPVALAVQDEAKLDAWKVTWKNLPKLSGGKAIAYRVVESGAVPEGAAATSDTVEVTFDGDKGTATLTNTLPATKVQVNKVWNDNDNQDGFRPDAVKVQLMHGTAKVGSAVTLDEDSQWKHVWTGVNRYDENGDEIVYSVVEVDDEGNVVTEIKRGNTSIYGVSVSDIDSEGNITVTNTHVTELTNIRITKVWDDQDDQDGVRPQTVTIYLDRQVGDKAKEEGYKYITLAETDKVDEDEWSYVFANLPKYEGGEAIVYSVREEKVTGYETNIEKDDTGEVVTVTNTHTPALVTISITKKWDDDHDRDKVRPAGKDYAKLVHLFADGKEVTNETTGYQEMTQTVTENQDDTFTVTYAKLPQFTNGAEIVYTVQEDAVTGYKADLKEVKNGETLTNTHELARVKITITKVWNDNANHDGKRPDTEQFKQYLELMAGTEKITAQTTGYEQMTLSVDAGENNTYIITYDGLLKFDPQGKAIDYTVNEATVPDGYQVEGESTAAPEGSIINKKDNELIEVSITKLWKDDQNRDGKRPTAKEYENSVQLLANGKEVTAAVPEYEGMTKVVKDQGDNTYTVTFSQLPKYAAGVEITYTVKEGEITGYTTDTPVVAVDGTIINTHIPDRYCVAVAKTWVDLDNRFHSRPAAGLVVTLQKSSDSGKTWVDVQDATLTEANGYAYMVQGVPAFEEGKELLYRWTEKKENIPSGYTHGEADEKNVQNGTITLKDGSTVNTDILTVLTNTLDLVQVPVTKVWNDDNNRDGKRPGAVTVRLFKTVDGKKDQVMLFTLSEADAEVDQKPWSHVFTDLPKYENGKEITYTVEEDQVTDYAEPIINGSAATGFIVTNVHQSERIKITANKIWNDNHNQDGKRGQITLVLSGRYIDADGEEQTVTVNSPEKTIRLDAPRNVAWSNLYKYENGHEILYSVTEKGMSLDDSTMVLNGATYYVSISGNALDGFTVINSYEPKQYAVAVSKTWEDMDNSFGTRPETITVTLQKRVGSGAWTDVKTATLSETNGWAYIEENLPAYESGKLLSYRWTEKSVPKGYEKVREEQIEGTVVINGTSMQADVLTAITNKLETVNVMVTKVWKDEFDADHIRPNTLEVKLKGSNTGSKVLDKVLLAPANNWTAVVEKLPAVDKTTGEKIVYTWDETDSDNKLPAGYELTTADPKTTPQDDKNYEHTILTNTHEVMRTQVTLTKKWVGDDHRASERAASFQLKADGNAYGAMVTLKGSADEAEATYVWENLPVYSDPATKKNEIQYTVEEVNPQPYYDVTGGELTGDAESGYEVVFVNTQQTSDLAVQKKVDSEALADATEKFTFTVTLTPAIEGTFGGMTFNASGVASFQLSGGETKIAEGLPAGISYKVEENPADNFVTTAQNEEGTLAPDGAQVLFVNKKITSGFVVTKKVVSALNKDVDPEQTKFDFTVVLDGATVTGTYGDMQFKDGKATFQLGNGETKTAENLPVGITYTVTESANPNFDTAKTGDKGTVTANQAGVASFVNTRKTGKLELTKKVSSAVPGDQQRLFAFKITLKNGDQWLTGVYSNYTFGKEGEARVWLKANETVTIKDIPVGTDYTIEEEPDPDALFTASPASTKGMITVETLERKETFTNTRKTGTLKITKTVVNPVEGEEDKTFVFIVTVDPAVQKGTYGDAAFDDAGSATVRIQGSGSATIKDLPQGVNYRVVEASDDAYVMTGEVGNIGTITEIGSEAKFTNVRKTTQFKVTKIWVDADNQDGKRDEVKIELLKNGKVVDTKPLNESGVALWTDLPETELDGKKIEYTFHEAGEAEGKLIMKDEAQYSVTYGDNTVTNTYIPETTSISVLKVWDDANDQDGKRASVNATLTLYKSQENGEPTVVETVNVPYTGGLVKAWDNLPVYEHGKKLTYSVKETIANTSCKYESDYAEATDVENNSTVTVTNRYTPETTKITIIKHWDDADDQDGKRAGAQASATLYRKVEGSAHEPVDVVTVGLEDGWEKTWDELPVYKDGKKITYSVVEAVGNGYTSSLTGKTDVENGAKLEITNSYTPEVTTITITKNWDDAEDQDGIREKVKAVVMVYAIDGAGKKTLVEEAQVPDANGTVFERTDLPVYSKGQKLTYTAVEILSENSGYVSSQATEGEIKNGELHITNIHTPAVTEAGVLKVWDDADNQDGVRPDSVTVKLFKTVDGEKTELMTLTLAADDTGLDAPWTHTETNLPAFEKGKPVTYSWEEEVPSGYELTATAVDKTVTKLTNSHTPEETEATVQKVWDDAEDQDGVRPKSLKVTLSNGDSVTLTADNKWTQTIEHLPKYKAGQEIEYTWTEDGLPAGYQLTSTVKSGLVTTLTNSYTPKTIQISVLKAWDDEDDVAGLRQSVAAVVTLYKTNSEGKTTAIESVVVPATDGKIKTWTDLPENEQGKKLVYSVKETLLNAYGYTTDTAESKEIKDGSITVTNSYVPEKTEATVEKLWLDENNLNNNRPEQLIVKLLANGKETGDTVTLNDENHWTDTLKDLPKYSGGKEIDYSWAEAPVKGYTQQSYRNGNKTTLINSMVVETTTVTVHKAWVDGNNLDGSRPDSIEMTLSNGMTVELNELNGWSASISGLPKYNGDDEIEYTWSEPSVPGYEAQVSKNGTVTVFTNTHIPKLGKMTAAKLWDDEDNQDGKRFDVTFQLISHVLDDEGTETITVVDEQSVGQEDGAQYEWTDLELITEEGKPIFYTVEEAGVSPDGRIGDYTVSISGTMGEGFLITNHYNPALYCIGVTKHWDDNDNADGIRPDSLTVHLSSTAGMEKDVVLNEENGWTHLERGVPMYFNNGTKIEYTWTEEEITNYTGKNQVVAGGTMTVFYNRHAPTPFTPGGGNNGLSGSKTWVDDNNAAGKRPASITVNLYANGTLVTSKKVTAADGWQWSFGDLPQQDENGQDINYTITEDAVPNYASTINGMNITNTYRAEEVTSVTVTKVWDDNNNAAGMRPANLRVTLSNGSSYVLNAGNNWTVTVNDLPKFRNGVEIAYTWSEQAVLGYKQTDVTVVGNTTIFTNTYQRPYTPTPNQTITIDDLPVALGLGVEINHVGDCFD